MSIDGLDIGTEATNVNCMVDVRRKNKSIQGKKW